MRILSVTAQKPNSTGSGIFLTELMKEFANMGHEQALVAGVYPKEENLVPASVTFYPVYFEQGKLNFPIVGMSDEMPYPSTRYRDLTPEMVEAFKESFLEQLKKAVEDLDPDLILCHHLYLLTAIVREYFPDRKVCGFCHNTDLRQMVKTDLKRSYIADQIRRLDRIFALHTEQKRTIEDIYDVPKDKIQVTGMGYNNHIFKNESRRVNDGVTRIAFAGKISVKKGVESLIRSLDYLGYAKNKIELLLAGGAGNEEEYHQIVELAKKCPYTVKFLGKLPQKELAKVYNSCDIFALLSFSEGLPLTVIEALACGERVVMTDLPGVKEWLGTYAPGADVRYVTLPLMRNVDEAVPATLPDFEKRIGQRIREAVEAGETKEVDVSGLSWTKIADAVLKALSLK